MRVICGLLALVALAGCADPLPTESEFFASPAKALPGQGIFAVQLTNTAKPDQIVSAARALCAGAPICTVMGWREPAPLPGALPLLDRELAAMSFRYGLNRNTGFEQVLWDCRGSKRSRDQCLSQE